MTPPDLMEAFWERVDRSGDCWLWNGPLDRYGYGRDGRLRFVRAFGTNLAHRIAYLGTRGEIALGHVLDHLCRNPRCVNPHHLEVVTQAENVRRGRSGEINGARMRAKTHCKRGHEFTIANTYVYPNGDRGCRACARLHKQRRQQRLQPEAERTAA